ncbi:MAG: ATP synthase F0 subunit B [Syntrophales bacterium]|nr:ATP synthase F0 subunit B [Syntrophales bacterium]
MLPSINISLLVIQGVIFLLVLWFLNRNLFKPILKILHERDERTEGFLQKSEEMEEKAKETFAEYTEKLRQARRETLAIKKKHILEGAERREEIFGRVRQEINVFLEEIRGKISEETESSRKALYQQIETLGGAIAEKVLGRSVQI